MQITVFVDMEDTTPGSRMKAHFGVVLESRAQVFLSTNVEVKGYLLSRDNRFWGPIPA